MFDFDDVMAVDIGSSYIKVLVGNKFKIKNYAKLKTPENSVEDGKIINIDVIYEVLRKFIDENDISIKFISFSIRGQDVILRHLESPIMNETALRTSIQFDIGQYLPQSGENYYIDYEIIDEIKDEDKKIYKLLVAAAPRDKVDAYVKLAEKLNMKLRAIDVSSNSITRAFKYFYKKDKDVDSVGIVDIGSSSTDFIIMEDGKPFIERELAFGINNIVREVSKKYSMKSDEAYKHFITNFNFNDIDELDEFQYRIKTLFDNLFDSFEKVIQFYTSGKSKKSLDKIIIIGEGCQVYGLDEYMKKYFNSEVSLVWSNLDIGTKTKFPDSCDFKYYVNALGLILKKDNLKELNLLPYELKDQTMIDLRNKECLKAIVVILIISFLGVLIPNLCLIKINNDTDKLNAQIRSEQMILKEDNKLKKQIKDSKIHIKKADKINRDKFNMSEYIEGIQQYVPKDVLFNSFIFEKGKVVIKGDSSKYSSISEFTANLQLSDKFKKSTITSIKYDSKTEKYNFIVTIEGVGGGN